MNRTAYLLALMLLAAGVGAREQRQPQPSTTLKLDRQTAHALFPGDAQAVFEHSDYLELIALDPDRWPLPADKNGKPILPKEILHGDEDDYYVWGRHEIRSPQQKQQLISAFYKGVTEDSTPALCFDPHHAIRAVKGKKIVDILICFACGNVELHYGDKRGGSGIGRSQYGLFNHILKTSPVSRRPWTQLPPKPEPKPGISKPDDGPGILP